MPTLVWRLLARIERDAERWTALAVVLLLIVGVGYAAQLGPRLAYLDEAEYHDIARSLIERGEYQLDGQRAVRAPLYSLALAGLIGLGVPVVGLRIANFVLLAGCALLVARIARRVSGCRTSGLFAAAWVFAYPVLIYAAGTLYPQTLAAFLFLIAIDLVARDERLSPGRAAGAGVAFGLLVLAVPTFLPLLLVLLAWLIVRHGRAAVVPGLIVVAATAATLAPWSIRNQLVLGRFVPVATNGGLNFLLGNSENSRPGLGTKVDIRHYHDEAHALSEPDRDAYYRERAWAWIRANPGAAARNYLGKLAHHFAWSEELATGGERSRAKTILLGATYLPLLGIALVGLWPRRGRRPHPTVVLLTALYLANAALLALFFTRIRFRLPSDFLLLALAGIVVGGWVGRRLAERAQATVCVRSAPV